MLMMMVNEISGNRKAWHFVYILAVLRILRQRGQRRVSCVNWEWVFFLSSYRAHLFVFSVLILRTTLIAHPNIKASRGCHDFHLVILRKNMKPVKISYAIFVFAKYLLRLATNVRVKKKPANF